MRLLLKTFIYLVGFLIILLAGAAVYLTQFFDANQYKPEILAAADNAGIPLEINGDLNITLYPRLGLDINQVAIRQPDQPETILAALERMNISVSVLPLLSGSVEADRILIDRLQADLLVDKQGRGNWQALLPDAENETTTEASQNTSPSESGTATLPAIMVNGIDVKDARFSFTDLQQGTRFDLKPMNLSSDRIQLGKEFPLTLTARIISQSPQLTADIDLQANVLADPQQQRYGMGQLRLQISADTPLVPGNTAQLALQADALADLKGDYARFVAQQLSVNGVTGQLDSEISPLSADPVVRGTLDLQPFNLKDLLNRMAIQLPEMAREDALSRVGARAEFTASAASARIEKLSVQLDDTQIQGSASVALPSQAILARLMVDQLNADHYLPPPAAPEATAEQDTSRPQGDKQKQQSPETDLLPVDLIRSLTVDTRLVVDQLTIKKLQLSDIRVAVTADNGKVNLTQADAQLYGGTIKNKAQLDASRTPLTLALQHKTQGVEIRPILATMADFDQLTGRLSADADLKTGTNRLSTLIASLQGPVAFRVLEGAFLDNNFARDLCTALDGKAKQQQWSQHTEFTRLEGSLNFENGIGTNKDLTLATPGIMLTGYGSVNLPAETFRYNMGAQITDANDKVCTVNPTLKTIRWPVACKGSYATPPDISCGLDSGAIGNTLGKLAEQKAKAALEAEKARLKAKAKAEEARIKAQIAEEKARLQAEKERLAAEAKARLEAEKQAVREKAEDEVKNKLKSLFE